MKLIVGLGNIGDEYKNTRHNYGFLLLDQIVEDYGFIDQGIKFKSEVFSGKIADEKIIAIKPKTYMNLSGEAVLEASKFYKIDIKDIIVFHDDIDFNFGEIRAKIAGGNAGHNGLKSVDKLVGKNYIRIRLGVGRPENKDYEISDYVLGKFPKDEFEKVEKINRKISDEFELVINEDLEGFLKNLKDGK
jgi:PTH1 family peptidyl-tRNA hydrolase